MVGWFLRDKPVELQIIEKLGTQEGDDDKDGGRSITVNE